MCIYIRVYIHIDIYIYGALQIKPHHDAQKNMYIYADKRSPIHSTTL